MYVKDNLIRVACFFNQCLIQFEAMVAKVKCCDQNKGALLTTMTRNYGLASVSTGGISFFARVIKSTIKIQIVNVKTFSCRSLQELDNVIVDDVKRH